MNKTAGVAKPTLRIVRMKIDSRWPEDGMRKCEVIVSRALRYCDSGQFPVYIVAEEPNDA